MAISEEGSCYLRQPTSKRFSVRKAEAKAVKVANAIVALIKDAEDRQETLASFLANNTKMTWFRSVQMLKGLGRLRTPFDALRAGFAVQFYPECFEPSDDKLDPPYLGDPIFPVHGRVLDCFVTNVRGREIIMMKFLAMNSIFAGRLYKIFCSPYVADKLLRKIYSGKATAPFVALSGCYMWLNSDLLTKEIMRKDLSDNLGVNSEEKEINKKLYKDRGDIDFVKTCSEPKGVSCYACNVPRSECRLSTRERRKYELQTEVGGDSSKADEQTLVGDVNSDT